MKYVLIHNLDQKAEKPIKAMYCNSFFCRLRGLMFRKSLGKYDGLLMIQARSDRVESSIHMFFMAFDLSVIWLDEKYQIVDIQNCRRWRPAYIPARPARYIIETHPERFPDFTIGDHLSIELCE